MFAKYPRLKYNSFKWLFNFSTAIHPGSSVVKYLVSWILGTKGQHCRVLVYKNLESCQIGDSALMLEILWHGAKLHCTLKLDPTEQFSIMAKFNNEVCMV